MLTLYTIYVVLLFVVTVSSIALAAYVWRRRETPGAPAFDLVPVARDLIMDSMADAVLVLDPQHRLVDANPAARTLLGWNASDLIGQPITAVLPAWSDLGEHQDHMMRAEIVMSEGEQAQHLALREQPIHDHAAQLVGCLVILRDITDRRQMEQALRESEEKHRLLIENLQEGVWAIDAEARTTYVNRCMAEMLGYTEEEMIGKHLFDFMDERGIEIAEQNLERRQSGIKERHDFEFLRRDGTRIYTTFETSAINDKEGNYQGTLAGVMDISERRQTEEALQRQAEERAVLNRIAHTVATVVDLPQALEAVVEIVAKLFDARMTAITLWHSDQMEVASWYDREPGDLVLADQVMVLPNSEELKQPLYAGESVAFPDVRAIALPPILSSYVETQKLQGALFAPLRTRGAAFGSLVVACDALDRVFSSAEIRLAETIATDIAAAIENARLYEQAREVAVAEERSRLARDLHDSVTQTLYSVAITAEALPTVWERHPDEAKIALKNLHRLSRGALAEMRSLLLELRPATLRETRLSKLFRQLAHATMGRTQLLVETKVEGERILPEEIHIALYRIAQEALNNTVKHAEATRASLHLDFHPADVVLSICDDGRGFAPDAISGRGFGLQNMADRAKSIDAEFNLQCQPGEGTRIEVRWCEAPVDRQAASLQQRD